MNTEKPDCPFELMAIDLDGTMVDSVGDLHASVAHMLNVLDLQAADVTDVRRWVGNGVERLVHRALTRQMSSDAPSAQFQNALVIFQNAYQAVNGQHSTLYPGVAESLEWLARLEVPMVLVTNKAAQFTYPLLKSLDIDHFFDLCIAGDEVDARKPAPAALLKAARHFQVNPLRSVLIGDSISDIKAARAARFFSISVSYGYNHGESVRELEGDLRSDAIIDSFAELPEVFKRLPV